MASARGLGSWYRRAGSLFWWISYSKLGRRIRESAGSTKEKHAIELLRARLGEPGRIPSRLTIADLYPALDLDYVINQKKSVRNVRSVWSEHLKGFFGAIAAADLDPDRVSKYIAGRQAAGAANATINRELAALGRMYKLAKQSGKLRDAPYIPHLEERNVRKGFVRDDSYEALARATGDVGLWLRAMFELGFTYGWRKSELLGLRVAAVDLRDRTIRLEAGETKNDEARQVDMTAKVFELLTAACAGKGPGDLVFTRERCGRVSTIVDMRDAWRRATAAAGCPDLLFHDLRRTAVRNMRRLGISEKVAMTISGHKTRSVFERYNIVDRADVREAVGKLERGARERKQRDLFEQPELFHVEQSPPKKAAARAENLPPRYMSSKGGVQ